MKKSRRILAGTFALAGMISMLFLAACPKPDPDPQVQTYDVTLATQGNGTLTADVEKAKEGDTVTLTAIPAAEYKFGSLAITGGIANTPTGGNNYTFTMPAYNVTVTATFLPDIPDPGNYGVSKGTITPAGAGDFTISPTQGPAGAQITLTYTVNEGFEFGVFNTVPSVQVTAGAGNTFTFEMPGNNVTVNATYTVHIEGKRTVLKGSVTPAAGGDFNIAPAEMPADVGSTITLTAEPAAGYELVEFTAVPPAGVTFGGTTENVKTFTLPDNNVTINVTFALIDYTITEGDSDNGSFTIDKATANIGETITLTFEADALYRFVEFTAVPAEGVTFTGTTGNTRTFVMPANNVTINAVFELIPTYAITKGTMTGGDFTFDPATPAPQGASITLTAEPEQFFRFLNFTADPPAGVSFTGTGLTRTFNMPGNDVEITANFEEIPLRNITKGDIIGDGDITITPAQAREGDIVNLTPAPGSSSVLGYFIFTPATITPRLESGAWEFTMPASDVTVGARFISPTDDLALGRGGFSMSSGNRGLDGGNQAWSFSAFNSTANNWQITDAASNNREAWIGVDLGAVYSLGFVRIHWSTAGDMMVNADIQVRNDAPSWWSPIVLNDEGTAGTGGTENNASLSDDGWTTVGEIRQIPRTTPTMTNPNPVQITVVLDENASGRYIRLKRKAPLTAAAADASPANPQMWSTWTRVRNMEVYMPQANFTGYTVTKGNHANCDFTISPARAVQGTRILLNPTPDATYKFIGFTFDPPGPTATQAAGGEWSFTMPAGNVTVNAEFQDESYVVEYDIIKGRHLYGDFTISPSQQEEGEIVTITPAPDAGFKVARFATTPTVTMTAGTGPDAGTWTFVMPDRSVTVNTVFTWDPTEDPFIIEDWDFEPRVAWTEHHDPNIDQWRWRWPEGALRVSTYGTFEDSEGTSMRGYQYETLEGATGSNMTGARYTNGANSDNRQMDLSDYTSVSIWIKANTTDNPIRFSLEMNGETQHWLNGDLTLSELDVWEEFTIPLSDFTASNGTTVLNPAIIEGFRFIVTGPDQIFWIGTISANK